MAGSTEAVKTENLEVIAGGKLLAAFEGREYPRMSDDQISAVAAVILTEFGVVKPLNEDNYGWPVAGGQVELAKERATPEYIRSLRYNIGLLNRNPNNDEDCHPVNGDHNGFTMLITGNYPDVHTKRDSFMSSKGWGGSVDNHRYSLIDYDEFIKPLPGVEGPRLVRFPEGTFTSSSVSVDYADIQITPRFESPEEWERRESITPLALLRTWVARIEADNGSVWQNPNFSTIGLPIEPKHWPR